MISESELKNDEEVFYFAELNTIKAEIIVEEYMNDNFPDYDIQDGKLTQDVLEVYKNLFWGITALFSTLLWLYFFIERFLSIKLFSYFK